MSFKITKSSLAWAAAVVASAGAVVIIDPNIVMGSQDYQTLPKRTFNTVAITPGGSLMSGLPALDAIDTAASSSQAQTLEQPKQACASCSRSWSPTAAMAVSAVAPDNRVGSPDIDLFSGNSRWEKQIVQMNGRKGLDASLKLVYNSLVWLDAGSQAAFDLDNGSPAPGFRLGLPVIETFAPAQTGAAPSYVFVNSSGARTQLQQIDGTSEYRSTNGALLSFIVSQSGGYVTDPSGQTMVFTRRGSQLVCTRVQDRFGNYISAAYNAQGNTTSIVDTAGRKLLFQYDSLGNLLGVQRVAGSSTTRLASFSYAPTAVASPFSADKQVVGLDTSKPVLLLHSTTLITGDSYVFSYTANGIVKQVSHLAPNGQQLGYENFEYATWSGSPSASTPRLSSASVWVASTNNSQALTRTLSGPDSSGKSILQWNNQRSIVEHYAVEGWQRGLSQQREYTEPFGQRVKSTTSDVTTWQRVADGQTSFHIVPQQVVSNGTSHGQTLKTVKVIYDSLGRAQETVTLNGAGAVTEDLVTTYVDAAPYAQRHILNLVSTVVRKDGSGAAQSRTAYTYDEGKTVSHQNGVVQFQQSTSTQALGLPTTVSKECLGCKVAAQQKLRSTHITYNATGTIATYQNDNGKITTFSYDDSFDDGQRRNTYAFPTSTVTSSGTELRRYQLASGRAVYRKAIDGAVKTFTYDEGDRLRAAADTKADLSFTRDFGTDGRSIVTKFRLGSGATYSRYRFTDGAKRTLASVTQSASNPAVYTASIVIRNRLGRRTGQMSHISVDSSLKVLGGKAEEMQLRAPSVAGKVAPAFLTLAANTFATGFLGRLMPSAFAQTCYDNDYVIEQGDDYRESGDSWFDSTDSGIDDSPADYSNWTGIGNDIEEDNSGDLNDENLWDSFADETDQVTTASGQGETPTAYETKVTNEMNASGLSQYFTNVTSEGNDAGYHGQVTDPAGLLNALQNDSDFKCGVLYGFHTDLGSSLVDCRSITGTFGDGSLQIVFSQDSTNFHYDVDKFNPYQDVVNFLGHAFIEVLPHLFRFK